MSHESASSKRSPSSTPVSRPIPLPDSSQAGGSSLRVPLSPLGPATTPKPSTVSLPTEDLTSSTPPASSYAHQATQSPSEEPQEPLRPLSMILTSAHGQPSSIALPELEDSKKQSGAGTRSKSPARQDVRDQIGSLGLDADDPKMVSSWWGEKHVSRPWHDVPKRKKTIPPEQAVALEDTRKRVAQAVVSALGTTADVVHEALYIGVDFLEFVPIPGLHRAASTLLNIWDAAQNVDMNRLGCLRLTERCADILLSVREEVRDAGDEVGEELQAPLAKLELCFTNVYRFMIKQKTRPWLKRYLKRDEILRDIAACDNELRDALGFFGLSIQIRILKQVQRTEKRREHETHVLSALIASRLFPDNLEGSMVAGTEVEHTHLAESNPYVLSTDFFSETVTQIAATKNALGIVEEHPVQTIDHPKILQDLETIHALQNSLDAASDMDDLRQLLREALQTNSDAEMLKVLQIGRQEMPDAIKTLQRALERLSDRTETDTSSQPSSAKSIVLGKVTRRVSVKEFSGTSDSVQRSETIVSFDGSDSSSTSYNASGGSDARSRERDTLDREFIETGIDTLRRMSRGVEISVPTWTITKYEVDRGEMIGVGFFSAVYKGLWRDRVVAIKVLAEATPRKLFLREMGIWKTLRHPNVLPLYGASSATGDPPWFFVTQYQKNGTLSEHLRRVASELKPPGLGLEFSVLPGTSAFFSNSPGRVHGAGGRSTTLPAAPWLGVLPSNPSLGGNLTPPNARIAHPLPRDANQEVNRQWDLFRFMHEIAKGMEYLHGKEVLHGDLKASNILVDDKYRCVISDFGQSEMKSEAFRISGTFPPHATLGWQSPEFMSGQSRLSTAVDVWAFSITCVEIMNMGRMPWSPMDDSSVRHFVLVDKTRPAIPKYSRFNIPGFQEIIKSCWQYEPEKRASFSKIARDFKLLRKSYAQEGFESPSPRIPPIEELPEPSLPTHSPDMRPLDPDLPAFLRGGTSVMPPEDILAHGGVNSDGSHSAGLEIEPSDYPHQESTVATVGMKMPEPVIYTPGHSSRSSSVLVAPTHTDGHIQHFGNTDSGYDSPPPIDERMAQLRNERRYRLLMTHEYHPSLTLPLWEPSEVELGSIGFLKKPEGRFVTLFNSYAPHKSDHPGIRSMPSIHGYGVVKDDVQRLPKKTVTQRALDMFIGSLTFRNSSEDVSRRPSFPLKAGHKTAVLYAETTEYRYMLTLDAAKRWFRQNVDSIMRIYGYQHHIQKEELFLIIGTLKTPNYALLVSHHHPEGHARFNVYANPKTGKPWGTFTTDTDIPLGPSYLEDSDDEIPRLSASKVSLNGGPWEAVLLARLRFKPDAMEPTSR